MLCPRCDGILNIRGCLSCGWQDGDSWPAHRLVSGSVHPLKPGAKYPERAGIAMTPLVLKNYGQLIVAPEPTHEPELKAETMIVPVEYIVGTLTDEEGQKHTVMVGAVPQGGDPVSTVKSEQAALGVQGGLLEIPEPLTKTVQ